MASSGNFATLLGSLQYQVGVNTTYSLGNLKYQSSTAGDYSQQASTIAPSSGKWYAEMYVNTVGNLHWIALVGDIGVSDTSNKDAYGNRTTNGGMAYGNTGVARFNGSSTSSGYSTYTDGDIIQIAFDIDNTKVWFGKNNTWQNSGDPANGTNASYTTWTTTYGTVPKHWHVGSNIGNTGATTFNFGQDSTFGGVISAGGNADGNGFGDFKYAPPSGFLALCTGNISVSDDIDPAQTDSNYPAKQFNAVTYTGNGGTQSINVGFQPDFLWFKNRGTANSWVMFDSTRGTTKTLNSNGNAVQSTGAYTNLDAFTSTGFDLDGGGTGDVNQSSANLIAYCWRAGGGTTSTNDSGSADSTVQANTAAGFSICLTDNYTAASGVTIGHGLGVKPAFYLHKTTGDNSSGGASQAFNWHVYHHSLGATKAVFLNLNNAAATAIGYWNNTEPTTDVLSLGNLIAGNGQSLVYAWAEVEGYSKFGIYEANGNTDGPFIYTGFRPRLIFCKTTGSADSWIVHDTARNTYNPSAKIQYWDTGEAEASGSSFYIDVVSNGFKVRSNNSLLNNTSADPYIYGAWADVPFKYNNTF